jgi:Gpi18-like mannosyltransferase
MLTLVGLVAVRLLDLGGGYVPLVDLGEGCSFLIDVPPNSVPGIWARWDSNFYLVLANRGYAACHSAMGFFPLYPLLMTGLSRMTGLSLAMSGMLISQLSYLAAILFFYKLARLIQDNHTYAMWSVFYLVLFPSSFFFIAVYAEALSLALSILAVYLILRTSPLYIQSGLSLGIASAARPLGWLLNVVVLVEFVRRRKFTLSSFFSLGVGLILSVSGVVLYVLYLYSITATFFAIPEAQAEWQRHWQYPWVSLWKSINLTLALNTLSNDWFLYAINWVDLLFTISALALTVVAIWWSFQRRFSWSLSIYLGVSLAFVLAQQGVEVVPLWGMTRWVAAFFPLYLILGNLAKYKTTRWTYAFFSASLLIFFTAWWTSGRWIG